MTIFNKAMLALALFAFVFVVVCPFTLTPTAVSKTQPALVALVALPMLAVPALAAEFLPAPEVISTGTARLLEILCTRLC